MYKREKHNMHSKRASNSEFKFDSDCSQLVLMYLLLLFQDKCLFQIKSQSKSVQPLIQHTHP